MTLIDQCIVNPFFSCITNITIVATLARVLDSFLRVCVFTLTRLSSDTSISFTSTQQRLAQSCEMRKISGIFYVALGIQRN